MNTKHRRHDIDALRVMAIGLLLIYHTTIAFQPWGNMFVFITDKNGIQNLWVVMSAFNIWRIPLLFFVSGMSFYFALNKSNIQNVLIDKGRRLLLPLLFGFFVLVPLHFFLWQSYNAFSIKYTPNPGHLWFLINLFIYILLFTALLNVQKKYRNSKFLKLITFPPFVAFVFIIEAILIKPVVFEMYAMTWHGFFLGMLAFLFGYSLMLRDKAYWKSLSKWKLFMFWIAFLLFLNRQVYEILGDHIVWRSIESTAWIFWVLSYAFRYFNKPNKWIAYLNKASYPIYVIHMLTLHSVSYVILPLEISPWWKFIAVLLSSVLFNFLIYEFVIKRYKILQLLLGGSERS